MFDQFTVTHFAKFLGLSGFIPLKTAMLNANNCIGKIAKAPVNMPKLGISTNTSIFSFGHFYKQSVITKIKAFLFLNSSRSNKLSSQNSSSIMIKITIFKRKLG